MARGLRMTAAHFDSGFIAATPHVLHITAHGEASPWICFAELVPTNSVV